MRKQRLHGGESEKAQHGENSPDQAGPLDHYYERKRWPIEPPGTIDAIRYGLETGGCKPILAVYSARASAHRTS